MRAFMSRILVVAMVAGPSVTLMPTAAEACNIFNTGIRCITRPAARLDPTNPNNIYTREYKVQIANDTPDTIIYYYNGKLHLEDAWKSSTWTSSSVNRNYEIRVRFENGFNQNIEYVLESGKSYYFSKAPNGLVNLYQR